MTTIKLKINKEEFKKKLGMETKVINHILPAEKADILRDKLESLEGDERIDAKAIKNLPKPIINSGGIQRIDQALDTNIEAPTDGQTLTYDADTGQWVNSDGTPGGGGTWGSITGNLSDQTDLQSALDAKADDNAVVHTTGNEDIDGRKNLLTDVWTFAQNFSFFGKTRTTDGAGYQFQLSAGDAKGESEAGGGMQLIAGNADSSATEGTGGSFSTIAGASRGSADGGDNTQLGGSSQDGRGGHSINRGGQSNGAGLAGEGRIEGADGATGDQDGGHTGAIGGAPSGAGLWGRFYIRTQATFRALFNNDSMTADRNISIPDNDGVMALEGYVDAGLLLKADDSTVVHNTGDESIGGHKYFTSGIYDSPGSNTRSIDASGRTLVDDQGDVTLLWNEYITLRDYLTGLDSVLDTSLLTASRNYKLPDNDGTIALLDNVIGQEFETVSKNLKSYPYDITYDVDDNIDFIDYDTGSGTITKTFGYTSGDVTTITLSGSTPGGINLIKTFTYSGGQLTSVAYS